MLLATIYGGSTLLATVAGTSTTYHHPDHLSNRAETDATGAVARTAGHFPYGESWYESTADPMKFTTYARDNGTGETGLDYAMFRHYNSGQGRFMSADLMSGNIRSPQSLNKYSYTGNDPINGVDPLGLVGVPSIITICQVTFISTHEENSSGQTFDSHKPLIENCFPIEVGGGGGGFAPVPVPGEPWRCRIVSGQPRHEFFMASKGAPICENNGEKAQGYGLPGVHARNRPEARNNYHRANFDEGENTLVVDA